MQIELKNIQRIDDIYTALDQAVELPSYFSKNLDALYDFLSTDLPGPITIQWFDATESRYLLGNELFETLIDLFTSVEEERDDFRFLLEPESDSVQNHKECGDKDIE
ncbi:hypothetical protein V757_07945 [Pelistega indica]|uniref:Barstar (barnase inhibitor) domain-containing protein n=1 Tax=Pelistega indica TaxID=1414851 RepID=V8G384_9BURK|nr:MULTISPECIES: barstar family protein [Pelistega]ETD70428.1 hypothetical protein V757_07945 [Pelistega indica]